MGASKKWKVVLRILVILLVVCIVIAAVLFGREYKSIKEQSAFCEKLYFDNMLKIGKYLYSCKIAFRVVPEVPILYGLPECYPHLVNDYSWVLELHQQKTANKIFPAG